VLSYRPELYRAQVDQFGRCQWRYDDPAQSDAIAYVRGPDKPSTIRCPHGLPGDRLWVREAWADLRGKGFDQEMAYSADTRPGSDGDNARLAYGVKWKPSIHMPRRASRILLEVVSVGVELLQEITAREYMLEGFDPKTTVGEAAVAFPVYWDSLNGKRGYSWASNPWVWRIEFRRLT